MPRVKFEPLSVTTIYEEKVAQSVKDRYKSHIDRESLRLINNITDDMRDRIAELLHQGIDEGKSVSAIASKLLGAGLDKGIFRSARRRAYLIARTELHRARQQGAADLYEANNTGQVKWIAIGDERVCEICGPRNNTTYRLENIKDNLPPIHPRCFINPRTPIFTLDGWKPIYKIEVGDFVLTHKGRFKKVKEIIQSIDDDPEVVTLTLDLPLSRIGRYSNKITLTSSHPLLCNNKWIEAENIKVGDKISFLSSKCRNCNKIIPFTREYCSQKCNGIKNQKPFPSSALKNSIKTNREKIKNGTFHLFSLENQFKAHSACAKKAFGLSFAEKKLGWAIRKRIEETNLDVELIPQFHILKKEKDSWGIGRDRYYFIDWAIPSLKIAIECDGIAYHTDKEKDKLRQDYIESLGWTFLRFSDIEINKELFECAEKVIRLVNNHEKRYKFVELKVLSMEKKKVNGRKRLYNFSVEEDESYVVKGFVVHNCRCRVVPGDFQLEINVRRDRRGKVMRTRISPTPQNYKYYVSLDRKPRRRRVKKSLEKAVTVRPFTRYVPGRGFQRYQQFQREVSVIEKPVPKDVSYEIASSGPDVANKIEERREGKVRATYAVNAVRAWNMEAKNKYPNSPFLGDVGVRECMQNSLDAVTEALEKGEIKKGKIEIELATAKDKFVISDNGIGMSDTDIRDKFLALYGTGKDIKGRFGGFGIAKAVILAPTESAHWELRTRDNFFDDQKASANAQIESISKGQGTTVSVWADTDIVSKEARKYIETTQVPKNVNVRFKWALDEWETFKDPFAKLKNEVKTKMIGDHTAIHMSFYPRPPQDYRNQMIIRLMDKKTGAKLTQAINPIYGGFNGCLIIDIDTTATPGSNNYPLTDSRMGLKWGQVQDFINSEISSRTREKKSAERVGQREKWMDLPETESWRPTLAKVETDTGYGYLKDAIDKIWKEDFVGKKIIPLGVSLDQPYTTLENIKILKDVGFKGSDGGTVAQAKLLLAFESLSQLYAVTLTNANMPCQLRNFYAMLSKPASTGVRLAQFSRSEHSLGLDIKAFPKSAWANPVTLAMEMVNTIQHEFTHNWIREHDEEFTSKLGEIQTVTAPLFNKALEVAGALLGKETRITIDTPQGIEKISKTPGFKVERPKAPEWKAELIQMYKEIGGKSGSTAVVKIAEKYNIPEKRVRMILAGYKAAQSRRSSKIVDELEGKEKKDVAKSVTESSIGFRSPERTSYPSFVIKLDQRLHDESGDRSQRADSRINAEARSGRLGLEGRPGRGGVLVKARSYDAFRHGKWVHVKGWQGKPRLWDLSPLERVHRYLLDPASPEVDKALQVANEIRSIGGHTLFIGGSVRDAVLGKKSKDIDLEVYKVGPERLKNVLEQLASSSGGHVDQVGKSFGVFKLSFPGMEAIDIAIPRRESKTGQGHKGFMVEHDPKMTFKEGAGRRDLTINALAYDPWSNKIIDEYNGIQDLKDGVLRATNPETFGEDSLRVLRVMRFAAQLEMSPDYKLAFLCNQTPLTDLPKERIFGEFAGMFLKARRPSIGLRLIHILGINKILPELDELKGTEQDEKWHPEGDVWEHTLQAVDEAAKMRNQLANPQDRLVYMFGVLCHDMGKPETTEVNEEGRTISHGHDEMGAKVAQDFLSRLTDESDIKERVETLVRNHMRPTFFFHDKVPDSAIRRLAKKVDIPMLLMVSAADKSGRGDKDIDLSAERWMMRKFKKLNLEHPETLEPKVMGRHLITIGIKPGPEMGRILDKIYNAQLEGKFETTDAGLEYANQQGWLKVEEDTVQKGVPVKKTITRKGKTFQATYYEGKKVPSGFFDKKEPVPGVREKIKEVKSTQDAYALGRKLSKEQAIEFWKEYKKRLASSPYRKLGKILDSSAPLTPEIKAQMQEAANHSFETQFIRETVEGYLGGQGSYKPEEIDEKLLGVKPKLQKELKDLKNEFEEKTPLLHTTYDKLAAGGRAKYRARPNPETESALKRLFAKGMVIDMEKARKRKVEMKKARLENTFIPVKVSGRTSWARVMHGGMIVKSASLIKVGQEILAKSGTATITAVGKDGVTARTSKGEKVLMLTKDVIPFVRR